MQLTVITREQFATKAWKRPAGYTSAAKSNILPVVELELAKLVPTMPLAFVKTADAFELVAITALHPGANYFVAPDGRWLGEYVPATLRSYPFRLVSSPKTATKACSASTRAVGWWWLRGRAKPSSMTRVRPVRR